MHECVYIYAVGVRSQYSPLSAVSCHSAVKITRRKSDPQYYHQVICTVPVQCKSGETVQGHDPKHFTASWGEREDC